MEAMKYIYGPVPSRRLGISLGISPIPKKTCNYSCIYCQLGRTDHMTNTRQMFFEVEEILAEFRAFLKTKVPFDVVTIVGEGEPTLYLGLGELIEEIAALTDRPVAVITNGALLYDETVRRELSHADLVLPTLDAYDQAMFQTINRPHGALDFQRVLDGLIRFAGEYKGQLLPELMLIKGVNDDEASLERYRQLFRRFPYDKLYINTPVRPPAEEGVMAVDAETMQRAVDQLGGISIDLLESTGFHSEISDDRESILSIIKRHPMNQYEIESFLKGRGRKDPAKLMDQLRQDPAITVIRYKGYETFRLK